ncbi:MAG: hypothetical protein WCT25_01610 [Candidatus Paceibacterota bacterium]
MFLSDIPEVLLAEFGLCRDLANVPTDDGSKTKIVAAPLKGHSDWGLRVTTEGNTKHLFQVWNTTRAARCPRDDSTLQSVSYLSVWTEFVSSPMGSSGSRTEKSFIRFCFPDFQITMDGAEIVAQMALRACQLAKQCQPARELKPGQKICLGAICDTVRVSLPPPLARPLTSSTTGESPTVAIPINLK